MLLTNADLDHVLGLFSLREGEALQVYATGAVQSTVESCLGLANVLNTFCGATWSEPPLEYHPLGFAQPPAGRAVAGAGLLFRAIALDGKPPPFVRSTSPIGVQSVAYQFRDPRTGRQLLVAPDVAALNPELERALAESDAVLFDGTFWSPEELARVKSGASTADQMGHVTIRDCSLDLLRKSRARHRIYLHINNTNPILASQSVERSAVEAAGIVVGYDGLEFEL